MNEKNDIGEFYLDDLSDCFDNYSRSNSGDESDGSDIIILKRDSVLPLRYSDLEVDEINNVEDYNYFSFELKTVVIDKTNII